MVFSLRVVGAFSTRDWSRGQTYYKQGAVDVVKFGKSTLKAVVAGGDDYEVTFKLDAKSKTLRVNCDCPRFDEVDICKHVAATVLAASDRGFGDYLKYNDELHVVAYDPELGDRETDNGYGNEVRASSADEDGGEWSGDGDGYVDGDAVRSDVLGGAKRVAVESRQATLARRRTQRNHTPDAQAPTVRPWKSQIGEVQRLAASDQQYRQPVRVASGPDWAPWYAIELDRSLKFGQTVLAMCRRNLKKDGTLGVLRVIATSVEDVEQRFDADARLVEMLAGNTRDGGYGYYHDAEYMRREKNRAYILAPSLLEVVLPKLCETGRFGWLPSTSDVGIKEFRSLRWDDGPAWRMKYSFEQTGDGRYWRIGGQLSRGEESASFADVLLVMGGEYLMFADRIARFEADHSTNWAAALGSSGEMLVPVAESDEFVQSLTHLPMAPPFELPEAMRWNEQRIVPAPKLTIYKSQRPYQRDLECRLGFQYGERFVDFGSGAESWFNRESRELIRRDKYQESVAAHRLEQLGARQLITYRDNERHLFSLRPNAMPKVAASLAAEGWSVEAEGRLVRPAGKISLRVSSGVDWFDLAGTCDFGDASATLPELLEAVRKGQSFVVLDDGSQGMLPADWLAKYGAIADMGDAVDDAMRFRPGQAALLDALLAAQESNAVTVDRSFEKLREKLKTFGGVEPRKEPKSFAGELRGYQREGLGWLKFLDEFGFGGCLADDMGLGKTVQVLAMLEERRAKHAAAAKRGPATKRGATESAGAAARRLPSLIVAPKSLIFNWMEEARRFAPNLSMLNYTGFGRHEAIEEFGEFDVVLTTYGTLRKDIAEICKVEFDYAILDEAQAVKNAHSQSAKACRLIRAERRLALSGTPVENHLGELWSLFEFLNPGMLGRNEKLQERFSAGAMKPTLRLAGAASGNSAGTAPSTALAPDVTGPNHPQSTASGANQAQREGLQILARAIRPFLLRRTKQQVLSELPEKTQQTLYCDLDAAQRKLYDELRDHYRRSLLERIESVGVNRSKIQVLEALLRLRQAACHPALLDAKKAHLGSAKLETLLGTLEEVIAEGHKALVFSQFTSFLAIVERELKQRKIRYEYLDGKTSNRQQRVERFQNDASCSLFLISLKAGGQGLNLTAADYVFILDPWWNPAVESQAVDRAHRMGQTRPVFAYRLIARDTVEEKILQLQDRKRDLADAIVSADNSILRSLTAEDLQLLLG